MKVVVTGGAGFIGSNLVDGYVARGDEVVVVDNLSSGRREWLNEQARFVEMDVTDRALQDLVAEERPHIVNHHAAQIQVRYSVERPDEDARINIQGIINVLEGCRRGGVGLVLFSSSGGTVYGEPAELPATESLPFRPLSPYGASKVCSEIYLQLYHETYSIPYVALRYGNVYGPRQDPHGEAGVIAIFVSKMLRGETPQVFGDGENTRDYVYVGDVVAANLACTPQAAPLALNIGTGVGASVNELVAHLRTSTGYDGPVEHVAPRTGEVRHICLDTALAAERIGWRPTTPLADGLRLTVEFVRAQLEAT